MTDTIEELQKELEVAESKAKDAYAAYAAIQSDYYAIDTVKNDLKSKLKKLTQKQLEYSAKFKVGTYFSARAGWWARTNTWILKPKRDMKGDVHHDKFFHLCEIVKIEGTLGAVEYCIMFYSETGEVIYDHNRDRNIPRYHIVSEKAMLNKERKKVDIGHIFDASVDWTTHGVSKNTGELANVTPGQKSNPYIGPRSYAMGRAFVQSELDDMEHDMFMNESKSFLNSDVHFTDPNNTFIGHILEYDPATGDIVYADKHIKHFVNGVNKKPYSELKSWQQWYNAVNTCDIIYHNIVRINKKKRVASVFYKNRPMVKVNIKHINRRALNSIKHFIHGLGNEEQNNLKNEAIKIQKHIELHHGMSHECPSCKAEIFCEAEKTS